MSELGGLGSRILEFVRRAPGACPRDIARAVGLTSPRDVNPWLYRLKNMGAVTKLQEPDGSRPRWFPAKPGDARPSTFYASSTPQISDVSSSDTCTTSNTSDAVTPKASTAASSTSDFEFDAEMAERVSNPRMMRDLITTSDEEFTSDEEE